MDLKKLKDEMSYKWKIQTKPIADKKGCCVAYIDSRDVQDKLDIVCGADKWQSEFYEVKGKVFCKIGIKIDSEWVWKSDSGALESSEHIDEETVSKGETSDAFKRAAVQWGIGRFLYEKDMVWITKEEYEKNKFKLTEFCNGNKSNTKTEAKNEQKKASQSDSDVCPSCGTINEIKHGEKDGKEWHLGQCECGEKYFVKPAFYMDKKDYSEQKF